VQQNNSIENNNFWTFHEYLINKFKHMLKNNDFIMTDELKNKQL